LLRQAGEEPPFVLVGHSAGVNTVRLFAEAYPEDVAGLVLIEPPILSGGVPSALVAVLRVGRIAMNVLARTGLIRWMGKHSRMGFCSEERTHLRNFPGEPDFSIALKPFRLRWTRSPRFTSPSGW
jgi:pimeloyl-ACP methyl ester carboxylesterase